MWVDEATGGAAFFGLRLCRGPRLMITSRLSVAVASQGQRNTLKERVSPSRVRWRLLAAPKNPHLASCGSRKHKHSGFVGSCFCG